MPLQASSAPCHCCPLLRETLPPACVQLSGAFLLLSLLPSLSPSHSHLSPHTCCYPHAPKADGGWSGSTPLPRLPLTRLAFKGSLRVAEACPFDHARPQVSKMPGGLSCFRRQGRTSCPQMVSRLSTRQPCGQKTARS